MATDKFYQVLIEGVKCLIEGETDCIANCANVSSLVFHELVRERGSDAVNWVGFYFLKPSRDNRQELVLGPFCGRPACIRIPLHKGVCGAAASSGKTQIVDDVHEFPGHISCDTRSKSELVIPLRDASGTVIGVFDLDCPKTSGFDAEDAKGLEEITSLLGKACEWSLFTHQRH